MSDRVTDPRNAAYVHSVECAAAKREADAAWAAYLAAAQASWPRENPEILATFKTAEAAYDAERRACGCET